MKIAELESGGAHTAMDILATGEGTAVGLEKGRAAIIADRPIDFV